MLDARVRCADGHEQVRHVIADDKERARVILTRDLAEHEPSSALLDIDEWPHDESDRRPRGPALP